MIHIETHKSLQAYNTFGIDCSAHRFVSVSSVAELIETLELSPPSDIFILGGGSNMLLTKNIAALVIHVDLNGIEQVKTTEDHVYLKVAAGENWHEFVQYCLKHDYGGIENLSLIPGNVGTAPIQNIGAYGVELKDVFEGCEAIHTTTKELKEFSKEECQFDYRNSIFKGPLKGVYIITSVTFKLSRKDHELKTSYGAISQKLDDMKVKKPTIQDISKAVIAIRESKLPDPKKIGNSGSFFKNPVISRLQFEQLKTNFPSIPGYVISDDTIKVPAGWLIETAGFKGKRFNNYGVHEHQALVLVNYGGAKGSDIFRLSKLIQSTIKRIFNINLESEVNII